VKNNWTLTHGLELAKQLKKELKKLKFLKDAEEKFLDTISWNWYPFDEPDYEDHILYSNYELIPEYLEEMFTLRIERHQIFVVSGIERIEDDRFISFVSVAFPYMGWELIELFNKDKETMTEDELWSEWGCSDLDILELPTDVNSTLRFYLPIMVQFVKDPFNDKTEYQRRREILILIIALLHEKFGFKIYYSQSGDIPHEIPDEWIDPYVIDEYKLGLANLNEQLAEDDKNGDLWYQKAGLLLSRDQAEEALVCLENAVKLDPNNHMAWYTLADTYTKLGNNEKAMKAEEVARGIMKRDDISLGSPDVFHYGVLFTPIYISQGARYHSYEDDDNKLLCARCDYDFLYIEDGIRYICNLCGNTGIIEDAALDVELSMENHGFKSGSASRKPMLVKAVLTNKTNFDEKYDTSHNGMEFILKINENNEDGSISPYETNFGELQKPNKKGMIKPGKKRIFEFDIRKINWLCEEEPVVLDEPGKYSLSVFVIVKVLREDDVIKSNSESNLVEFEIV
jgi:tetratricopeptide (TPR) repeat protein